MICLDILRTMQKEPDALALFWEELNTAKGMSPIVDQALHQLQKTLHNPEEMAFRARTIVETMALIFQATLLLRHGNPDVAEAFVRTRIQTEGGRAFGTLPLGLNIASLLERMMPSV